MDFVGRGSVVLLGLLAMGGCDSDAEKAEKACQDAGRAYLATHDTVKERLAAPATAVFPEPSAQGVKVDRANGCRQHVEAYVDAQNIYGALVRARFYAFVEIPPGSDNWKVDALVFDANNPPGLIKQD